MKRSEDQSFFAWEIPDTGPWSRSLPAESPAAFHSCSDIVRSEPESLWNRIPYSITNIGLSIEMPMIPWAMETYLATLDCEVENSPESRVVSS
jgi:hypothetical protein